ncbi:hypothetical protein [Haloarchaeobius sp. HRN-SO-5]|uniref:hypothetical protein n=1 Tax=Haloarchaeobius sp. HRN-SO-5 TaxID=3446118 RepID=UPI003EBD47CC
MTLPNGSAAPDELFDTFPEDTLEEIIALADLEVEPTSEDVGSEPFERFVDGVSVDRSAHTPADDGDGIDIDVERLFG